MMSERAVVFGASFRGMEALERYRGNYNVIAFSDNDKNKWGTEFCGIKVIPPDEIKDYDKAAIIVASMYWEKISSQLYGMGYNNILIYISIPIEGGSSFKHKLIPVCNLSAFAELKASKSGGNSFISDFEEIFPKASLKNICPETEIIYQEKNVLFFAYYFPPIGSSGVQRSLKFVKYLRELGWNPIVIACAPPCKYCATDESLLDEIPGGISVIRIEDRTTIVDEITAKEMRQAVSLLSGATGDYNVICNFVEKLKENNGSQRNFLLYRQSITAWILDVLSVLPQMIDFQKIDAVYVTSGPYMSSLIGYYVKNKYKKPWIMDFRDPWTQGVKAGEIPPKWVLDFEFALEKNMLKHADHIIALSHICVDDYKNIFGVPKDKISLILNGYDEADFETVDTETCGPPDKLKVIYNGSLHKLRSSPLCFINAVNEAIKEAIIKKGGIEIEFVGERKPLSLEDEIKDADVYNIVTLKPYADHVKSLQNLSNANVLLIIVLDNEGSVNMYTGKIFEYLRMHRRILALAPKGCILEQILMDTRTGACIHPDDKEGIKSYLKNALAEIKSGKPLNINKPEIEKYERRKGAEALASILDSFRQE